MPCVNAMPVRVSMTY